MDLTVSEAIRHFESREETKKISEKLQPLTEVGLSYLHLNQALFTLSGGELQRMKLASVNKSRGKVFVIDEPTTGLNLKDVSNLLKLFKKMVEDGNTVFAIEHNLDLLKAADYCIELGPKGGKDGGRLLYQGIPQKMLTAEDSVTVPYLRKSANL